MRNNWLRKMVIVAMAAACGWLYMYTKETKAVPRLGFGQPACVTCLPREWGEYKGGSQQSGLVFRDSAGTLQFFANIPCGNPAAGGAGDPAQRRDELKIGVRLSGE